MASEKKRTTMREEEMARRKTKINNEIIRDGETDKKSRTIIYAEMETDE